ncbi:MAG: conserved phage C-terminal domain-containing protein [Aerococcus urinaeequi]
MAQRRMFSKRITDTDIFTDMPLSTQCLYFHLNMNGDDDGFVDNTKRVQKMIGASDDDLKLLFAKEFLIPFESGVVVIKDWKVHNYIRGDRYQETVYTDEKSQLTIDKVGKYKLGIPVVDQTTYQRETQDRIGKDRLGKDKEDIVGQPDIASFKLVVDYLNQQTGKQYKPSSKATQRLITARLNEGFSVEDFKQVIDNKVADWINDKKFSEYLRPETLFGTKFESYLNQKSNVKQAPAADRYDLEHLTGRREPSERHATDFGANDAENEDDFPF